MPIQTINPANGKIIKSYDEMPLSSAQEIIIQCHEDYLKWQQIDMDERSKKMRDVASILEKKKQEFAEIITIEMGKPITQALHEIEKCALVCNHYATHAKDYLTGRSIQTEFAKSYVSYHSIGIVFAIMPWNYPFWQVFRFAAPTLMAGNAALLKHAPNSTGAALAIEKIFQEAKFPKNLFRSLVIANDVASDVIKDNHVKAVTLTGSEKAGGIVGSTAAGAVKKVVLELGGCDPYIILEDADLDLAVSQCIESRLNNCGQVCISAKRIIVVESIKDEVIKRIKVRMEEYQKSDPMDPKCLLGPIARNDLREGIHQQVNASIEKGAKCLMGGEMDAEEGFYYPATLLTDVKAGMAAYQDEIFGPVVTVISAKNTEEAVNIANQSEYGLSAGIFTSNEELGEKIARDQLNAGICCVNSFAASDPRLPFGGTKKSGYGRELSSEGIREFCNIKTVCVK